MRAGSSSTVFRPDQLEGMSRLEGSLLQPGICIIPSTPSSSYFYTIALLAVKKCSNGLGRPQGLHIFLHVFYR